MRIIIFLVLAVFLSACGNKKEEKLFKTVEYQTSESSESPRLSFDFHASVDLPEDINGEVKDVLRDNIVSAALGSPYVRRSDSKLLKAYADSSFSEYVCMFSDLLLDLEDDVELEEIKCATDLDAKALYVSDNLLVYQCALYTYSGGAHGMTTVLNYIFDLSTGKLLKENDIFKPEYHRLVHNLLVNNAALLRNDSILPAVDDSYFNNSLIQPNGNVSVNDSAIVYTFNPYEIAPYCFGIVDVCIPKEQILPLLDSTTVVYHHLNK